MREIRRVAQYIAEKFRVEKIYLFGSYAHGKPTGGSDVDYLVVMNHDQANNRKQMFEIADVLEFHPFPMDIVVRTPKDIRVRIPQGDWFLKDAVTKGRLLYERRS
jgi:predicted nucleotidyltransferase